MHQHPRPPPATASPASSPRTNPTRTNNPRDQDGMSSTSTSTPSEPGGVGTETSEAQKQQRPSTENRDYVAKLNQVIQNFFTKAALIILSQRTTLEPAYSKETGERRTNKWFNVEIDETNDLLNYLQPWKASSIADDGPPDMVIETYIDAGGYNDKGGLILQDEQGRQWGVEDALRSYMDTHSHGEKLPEAPQVILERWRLRLDPTDWEPSSELDKILPKVYKYSIMHFRSLFAYMKLLPAWELANKKRRNLKQSQRAPTVKYRIYIDGEERGPQSTAFDELNVALDGGSLGATEKYSLEPIQSPAGVFSINLEYRTRCDFRVEKSMESVYSSRFIGQDEDLFKPSLDRFKRQSNTGTTAPSTRASDAGSLPQAQREIAEIAEKGQAYGSLSTFHGAAGARVSASPMSALRAATNKNAPSTSEDSLPSRQPPDHRSAQGSRSSLRSEGAPQMSRRTSVSFMPFKAPTLSASPLQPLQTEKLPRPPARQSVGPSALSALAEARKPTPNAVPNSTARPSSIQDVPASLSSSPRPSVGTRYSSSFGHRRAKLSVGGSKTEDDDKNSSGKASLSSSVQRGSGMMAERSGGTSSESVQTDDDNISDFLKMLDQKKDLKSFATPTDGPSTEAATRRTNAALSKFHRLRDSNAALTDSISSSLMLHRSSTSSSRQLSSVPPMVAGNSTSISSSPAERMSPRTPHTPAIPSRLSANSIAEYSRPHRPSHTRASQGDDEEDDGSSTQRAPTTVETGAIDIPTSPRPYNAGYRRSSSVAQQNRHLSDDDLADLTYGMRSASMGDGDERPQLSMSELLQLQEMPVAGYSLMSNTGDRPLPQSSVRVEGRGAPAGPYRARGRGGSSASVRSSATPEHGGSSTSLGQERGTGSGSSDPRGGRYMYSSTRAGQHSGYDDDEGDGMLFTMN